MTNERAAWARDRAHVRACCFGGRFVVVPCVGLCGKALCRHLLRRYRSAADDGPVGLVAPCGRNKPDGSRLLQSPPCSLLLIGHTSQRARPSRPRHFVHLQQAAVSFVPRPQPPFRSSPTLRHTDLRSRETAGGQCRQPFPNRRSALKSLTLSRRSALACRPPFPHSGVRPSFVSDKQNMR